MRNVIRILSVSVVMLASGLALAQTAPDKPAEPMAPAPAAATAPAPAPAAPVAEPAAPAPVVAPAPAPAVAPAPAPAVAPATGGMLDGAGLRAALAGNTVVAKDGDKTYTEYFAPDGRYVEVTSDGTSKGAWEIKGNNICTVQDKETTCWRVILNGQMVIWLNEKGDIDSNGSLVTGNPFNF